MIGIGEETGRLDRCCKDVFYEAEVSCSGFVSSSSRTYMIVVLGVVVLFIVLALFMPFIAIIGKLTGD
jgi:type II secretory pathway component PulF